MPIIDDYLIDCSIEDIGLDADILYKALLGDQCFCLTDICPPPIDLSGPEWTLPIDDDLFKDLKRVDIDQLVNDEKTGAFDKIAKSVNDLLKNEFEKNRITAADYAHTFAALIEAALSNATQFLLQKDLAFWQSKKGLYEAWATKAQVELVKHQIALAQMQQLNQQIEFANGKMQIMVNKEQYCNAVAQREVTTPKAAELNDAQIRLYNQQIISYQRDAEVKAANIFTNAWITMRTVDEGLPIPDGFTKVKIDDVLKTLIDKNGFYVNPTP